MLNLPYIFEVQIGLAVLWTGYRIFLGAQSFFARNRAYLLGISVAAWLLPVLSIPVLPAVAGAAADTLAPVLPAAAAAGPLAADIPAAPLPAEADRADFPLAAIYALWAGGAVCCLFRYGLSAVKLYRTVRRFGTHRRGNVRVFRAASPVGSFSFFGRICVEDADGDRQRLAEIAAHERCHARLGHSWDRVWAAVLCAALWWSPFAWLWSRSLREVHEYQADRKVLNDGFDSRQYITQILRQFTDLRPELVSGFSYSLVKKRLTMISRENSPRRSKLRILLSLPLAGLLLPLVSFTPKPPSDAAVRMAGTATVHAAGDRGTTVTETVPADSLTAILSPLVSSAAQSASVYVTRTKTVRSAGGRDVTVTETVPADSLAAILSPLVSSAAQSASVYVTRTKTVRNAGGRDTTITETLPADSPEGRMLIEAYNAFGESVPALLSSVDAGLRKASAMLRKPGTAAGLRQAGAELRKIDADLQRARAEFTDARADDGLRQVYTEFINAGFAEGLGQVRDALRIHSGSANTDVAAELRRVRAELRKIEATLRQARAGS